MRALTAQYGSLVAIEAYAEHRAILESADAQGMDRRVVRRAMGGRVSGHDVIKLQRGREDLIAALGDELKGALLVLPATPMTAPPIDALERDDELFPPPTCAPYTIRFSAICSGCAASPCHPERTRQVCRPASSSLRLAATTIGFCRSG